MTRRDLLKLTALAAVTPLAGCKTMTAEDRLGMFSLLLESAAYTGAAFAVSSDPATRPAFEAAREALAGLLNRADYDPARLESVIAALLAKLGKSALKGDTAAILVGQTLVVFDVGRQRFLDLEKAPVWVHAALVALESGFRRALEGSARRSAKPEPTYEIPRK